MTEITVVKKVTKRTIANKWLTIIQKIEIEVVIVTLFITLWTILFHHIEWWRYFDSFYFIISTVAAVWLWDFHPITDWWKAITIFFEIIWMPIFAYTTSLLVQKNFKK